MSRNQTGTSQALSPAKLATIVVLALVLVVVVVVQFSGGGADSVSLKKRPPRSVASNSETSVAGSVTPATPNSRLRWPDIQREEVAAFNPFAIPESLRPKVEQSNDSVLPSQPLQVAQSADPALSQPTEPTDNRPSSKEDTEQARIRAQERKSRIKRIQATATSLQQQGVTVVMSTSTGAAARIGDQDVRVGDVINGVLRVVEITPQGIVVEEAPGELP